MEERLQEWASRLTTTHKLFSHDLPLTPQHFSILTQDKSLKGSLAFLVRQVVPPDQARLIRLNLKHARIRKSLKEEGEEPSSLREYLRLKATTVEARAAITAETTEILRLNQQKEELHQGEIEARRKAGLVRSARQVTEQQTHHYDLWRTQLSDLQDNNQHNNDATNTKANMVIKNKLRADLEQLERVHHAILTTHPSTSHSLHQMKESVWERIGDSFEEWSPEGIMEAVVLETRESQHTLRSLLQAVDLARDARDLRAKCESAGTFMDETNPRGMVESVQELLRHMSAGHVKLHLQAHQENQAALSLTRVLNTLTNNINTAAKRSHEDEEVAGAVVTLVKTSCVLAGERAALTYVHSLTTSLQGRADTANNLRLALKDKQTKVARYEKQEKVHNIQSLVSSVQGGRDTVRKLLTHLRASMKEVLSLTTTPTPFSITLTSECEKLHALPLSHLLTTPIDVSGERKQKACLSTTPGVWHSPEAAAAAGKAAALLCPGMRCWDSVYEAACQRLHLTTSLHCQMHHLTTLHQELGVARRQAEAISTQAAKELMKQVDAHDEKMEAQVREMVEDTEKQVTQGFQLVTKFTQHMADWWEQPAQRIQVKGLKSK